MVSTQNATQKFDYISNIQLSLEHLMFGCKESVKTYPIFFICYYF